jgi:hypothetical protein
MIIRSTTSAASTPPLEIRGLSSTDVWDFENGYHWFSHPTRMGKMIAHYELYKQVAHLPGAIVELGVYKVASIVRFATFRRLLENDDSRQIIGFDMFGSFPTDGLETPSDLTFAKSFEASGGPGLSIDEATALLVRKGFSNIELVGGNVMDTLATYLDQRGHLRVALAHLDMDVKEPTTHALALLYDRVVPGGLIVFDDYGTVAGETEAVDEFIAEKGLTIERTPFNYIPSYVRKPDVSVGA